MDAEKIKKIITSLKQNPLENDGGEIYSPLPFKEFESVVSSSRKKSTFRRWEAIKKVIPYGLDGKRILDIGPASGFFSYKFALEGARVDAVEPNNSYYSLGKEITELYKLQINWSNKPIEDFDLNNQNYDITIMFSVFCWILLAKEDKKSAFDLLYKISQASDMLFFELGGRGPSIRKVYRMLKSHTSYKNIYFIGFSFPWKIYRPRTLWVAFDEAKCNISGFQKIMTWIVKIFFR